MGFFCCFMTSPVSHVIANCKEELRTVRAFGPMRPKGLDSTLTLRGLFPAPLYRTHRGRRSPCGCLVAAWWPTGGCLVAAWWPPSGRLVVVWWRRLVAACWSPGGRLVAAWWSPGCFLVVAWWPPGGHLVTA
jgi:hypothetical protein